MGFYLLTQTLYQRRSGGLWIYRRKYLEPTRMISMWWNVKAGVGESRTGLSWVEQRPVPSWVLYGERERKEKVKASSRSKSYLLPYIWLLLLGDIQHLTHLLHFDLFIKIYITIYHKHGQLKLTHKIKFSNCSEHTVQLTIKWLCYS